MRFCCDILMRVIEYSDVFVLLLLVQVGDIELVGRKMFVEPRERTAASPRSL